MIVLARVCAARATAAAAAAAATAATAAPFLAIALRRGRRA